jgi:hypothetical protein
MKNSMKRTVKKVKRTVKKLVRKIKEVDILDGKKKTERLLRRILILLLVILVLVLSFMLLKKGTDNKEQPTCEKEYQKVEETNKEVAVIDTEEAVIQEVKRDKVKEYIVSYGGRINDEYLNTLRKYCDEDTLKLVVAISVAETNMGKATDNHSNFYGYFYKGNRSYDPSYEEMSRVICNGVSKYYPDVATNRSKAVKYTGNDNVDRWIKVVNSALSKME